MDNLRHRYLHSFQDGNICELIFEVIDNKVITDAKWKDEPVNYELLDPELYVWNSFCAIHYNQILEDVYGKFYLGLYQEIIKGNNPNE